MIPYSKIEVDVSKASQYSPAQDELEKKADIAKPFVNLIIGNIKHNVKTSPKIFIYESDFPEGWMFSHAMKAIGELFSKDEVIQVFYEKPEDKNPDSPTFKNIFPRLMIKNTSLIAQSERINALLSETQKEVNEQKNKINSLLKRLKNTGE